MNDLYQMKTNADVLRSCLDEQRKAFSEAPFDPLTCRQDRLWRLERLLREEEQSLVEAISQDFTYRSREQSQFAEVTTTLREIRHCRRNVGRWMKPQKRSAGLPFSVSGGSAEVRYQPLGVVGIISPWNFPVNLCFSPLAGVLAAGNRAMIKPSELTPATAAWMAEAVPRYFERDEVAVVTGGADVASEFSSMPFDHLVYTGGDAVARKIMAASAPNLTPLTLELGGKSPVVIGGGAKLSLSCERIMFGKVFNAGQICLAPDTVYVPEEQLEKCIQHFKAAAQRQLKNGSQDFVSVINGRHYQRLQNLVVQAEETGCRVETLNLGSSGAALPENMMPIHIVIDPPKTLDISQQEIFGPLLVLRSYQHFKDVVTDINKGDRPLALYYFGRDKSQLHTLLEQTQSGGVSINDVIMHYTVADLPFGGVGNSGMGHYHGIEGFKQFSNSRSVFRQSPWDVASLMRPPYGKGFALLSKLMRSWL